MAVRVLCLWFIVTISNENVCEASTAEINWTEINAKLPTSSSQDDKAGRKALFKKKFDLNGNGVLSLAEIDKAVRDVLKIDVIFDAKPAIMRAFEIAKKSKESKRGSTGNNYVELREFKFFLLSLRQNFEYYVAYSRVDTSNDKKIDIMEFKAAQPKIERWVGRFDADKEFEKIDANGDGIILFEEFCNWAITKNLDLEDDDDNIPQ